MFSRNACNLEKVTMWFIRKGAGDKAHVDGTVAAFQDGPNLRHLEISDYVNGGQVSEASANVCRQLRLKRKLRLYVEVRGVEYSV